MAHALPEALRDGWDQTVSSGPPPESLTSADSIAANAAWCGLPAEGVAECQAFGQKIHSDEGWTLLAHHLHRKIYSRVACPAVLNDQHLATYPNYHLSHFPKVITTLSEDETAILYLLLYLDGVPGLVLHHQRRGIPEDVTRSTLGDIGVWARAHKTNGLSPTHLRTSTKDASWGLSNLSWPMLSLTGEMLRIGRLQHKMGTFNAPLVVYKHRTTHTVTMVVAEPNIGFDVEGLQVQSGHSPAWISVNHQQRTAGKTLLVATKISPVGYAERNTVTLDMSEWEVCLQSGDPILEIHIPEGGSMSMDACKDGLQRTVREYSAWTGDTFVGFTCSSWMLDPHFSELLPPTSNIVRFQRETYCHPTGADGNGLSGYERLFAPYEPPRAGNQPTAEDSTLQAAFLGHVAKGGRWIGGGCIILKADVEKWGEQM